MYPQDSSYRCIIYFMHVPCLCKNHDSRYSN